MYCWGRWVWFIICVSVTVPGESLSVSLCYAVASRLWIDTCWRSDVVVFFMFLTVLQGSEHWTHHACSEIHIPTHIHTNTTRDRERQRDRERERERERCETRVVSETYITTQIQII